MSRVKRKEKLCTAIRNSPPSETRINHCSQAFLLVPLYQNKTNKNAEKANSQSKRKQSKINPQLYSLP